MEAEQTIRRLKPWGGHDCGNVNSELPLELMVAIFESVHRYEDYCRLSQVTRLWTIVSKDRPLEKHVKFLLGQCQRLKTVEQWILKSFPDYESKTDKRDILLRQIVGITSNPQIVTHFVTDSIIGRWERPRRTHREIQEVATLVLKRKREAEKKWLTKLKRRRV